MVLLQYKEFLMLYNRLTENCFSSCATNFNYRKVTPEEVWIFLCAVFQFVKVKVLK